MPSAARRLNERWRPSLADRLQQSQKDRQRRGARKRSERELRNRDWEIDLAPMYRPSVITLNSGTTTQAFITNSQIDVTTAGTGTQTITLNTIFGGTITMNNNTLWRVWTINDTTTGCTDCGTNNNVWGVWYDRPAREYNGQWTRWVDTADRNGPPRRLIDPQVIGGYERFRVIETEEQKKIRLEQEAQWRREAEEREKQLREEAKLKAEAEGRAMDLLNSCLSKEQRACLQKNGFFFVMAKSGRKYRIDKGTHGNVKVVDKNNQMLESLCIQPGGVPVGDSMLAQKLLIDCYEDAFRRHANITLKDGTLIRGDPTPLDGDKLAQVIPIRRAA